MQAYEQSVNAEMKRLAQPFDASITTAGLQSPMHNYANVLYAPFVMYNYVCHILWLSLVGVNI